MGKKTRTWQIFPIFGQKLGFFYHRSEVIFYLKFRSIFNLSLYNLITRWLSSPLNLILNLLQVSLRALMATKERLRYIKNGEELEAPTWS